MNVLVVYASKYGSTAEIAQRIAAVITACGHTAEARPAREVRTLDGVGAVVLGSAVYMGSWLKDASAFVDAHREQLRERPVWLFSSGPLPGAVVPDTTAPGAPEDGAPKNLDSLIQSVGAREHRVFAGRLDPSHLKGRDRLIRALPAGRGLLPDVDGRQWDAIESWARSVAHQLDDSTDSR